MAIVLAPSRPAPTASVARWLAVGLLATTGLLHLALFPSHAGLVDEAAAHPEKPTVTTQAPAPTVPAAPIRQGDGRPEPPPPPPAAPAPAPYMSPAYVGWLFLLGGVVSLVAARHVLADRLTAGWGLGMAVCGTMTVCLLAARTVGLPGGYSEGSSTEGNISLAVQLAFVALAGWRLLEARRATG